MQDRSLRLMAVSSVAVIAASTVAIVPLAVIFERGDVTYDLREWFVGVFGPAFALSGWWLISRKPRLVVGWLIMAAGVSVSLAALAAAWAAAAYTEHWPGVAWGRWVFSWLWQPHMTLTPLVFLLFPDGVIRGRVHRLLLWSVSSVTVLSMLVSAVKPGYIITTPNNTSDALLLPVRNPLGIEALERLLEGVKAPLLVAGVLAGMAAFIWVAWWWRHSVGAVRKQFRWATMIRASGALVVLVAVTVPAIVGAIAIAQTLASQLLIVVAILQWRAYNVDVVLRRSILAVALLGAAIGTYAAVVIVVSVGLGRSGAVPGVVGAVVAIFSFGPMSTSIRQAVNRAFYGKRDDPYVVVSELGRRLAGAADPSEGLDSIVNAICGQLRLPFAQVVDNRGNVLAERGAAEAGDTPVSLPLTHQGENVGTLRVGHRRGSTSMKGDEAELLASLSLQVGAAVAALRLLRGLQLAQERLVLARQEERRRIQHDLHDGLTPQLTAVTLKLDAARNHISTGAGGASADELVASARSDVHRALGDVRRLVYALGDPTIASLGLGPAIIDRVTALTRPAGIDVGFNVGQLPDLSAAAEEAVYRIVVESVTNTVRHAGARRCEISVAVDASTRELVARVADDGSGIAGAAPTGIGTQSMRERAEQLGGDFDMRSNDGRGTVVVARIPLGDRS